MANQLKLCLVSSAGGHLSQLLALSDSWKSYDKFWITTSGLVCSKLEEYGKVYVAGECNREHPLKVLRVLFYCGWVILRQRPEVVISTGAAVGCIACFWGKLFGAKVVWIDSITNVEKLSLSGHLVKCIADLFLVQWPELARKYPGSEYAGAIV